MMASIIHLITLMAEIAEEETMALIILDFSLDFQDFFDNYYCL